MKLFWKLFCSIVLITVIVCSVGGYILIDTQFRASLNREAEAIYEENDLLRYTIARELEINPVCSHEEMAELLSSISITTGRDTVSFRISDEGGVSVVTSGNMPLDALYLTQKLPDGQRGWTTQVKDERTYIHAASPMVFYGETFYLENYREVTSLFTDRHEQYRVFSFLMLGLALASGILSLAVTSWILRPLSRLSEATKRMAEGDLEQRVRVIGNDELGRLSADFNTMASRLEEQVQELTDAAQRQEDFMGSFAHEIKTPLTSIIGYADLLRSRPSSPEQLRKSAEYIFSEGRRLEALSRKLMELIVLEKQDFPLRTVDMYTFLEKIGDALRPAFEQRGLRLRVRAAAAQIPLEPDLMETVCLNLLDNARKAIDGKGIIILEGIYSNDTYCIRVTDNGKGIPAQELSRITEAFYMVDKSRARAQGGAGLGLAVCQRIVSLHGGKMVFSSVEGNGTRVSVYLKGGII